MNLNEIIHFRNRQDRSRQQPARSQKRSLTFLSNWTLSCQALLSRGVYEYWVSWKYLARMSGLTFRTLTTSCATKSSSVACFSPTKNWSKMMLPALCGSKILWSVKGPSRRVKSKLDTSVTHLPAVPKLASWKLIPCLRELQRSRRKLWTSSRMADIPACSEPSSFLEKISQI